MKILTFDIEEWFHILDNSSTKTENEWKDYEIRIHENVNRILSLLAEKNQKASFFCLGWIAEKYPEVVRRISDQGHEIGSHSHLHQLVYEQSPKEFREDIKRSILTLEDAIGKKITSYRSPGFSLTQECFWAFEILAEFGIKTDCSIFPAQRSHGGVGNFSYAKPFKIKVNGTYIQEMPMNFYRFAGQRIIFSGGGYFRLLPYTIIKQLTGNLDYVMTYFHPRDFDAEQPVIPNLGYFRQFKSYYGLTTSVQKLTSLLDDFTFVSLSEACSQTAWDECPTFEVLNHNGYRLNEVK